MDAGSVGEKIVVALDKMTFEDALTLVSQVGHLIYAAKGHDLMDREGVRVVCTALKSAGAKRVWVDYKLHDIPETVENRAQNLAACGADMITVHAAGGVEMMKRALKSGAEIIAVTLLTSISEEMCIRTHGAPPATVVPRWAAMAVEAGVKRIVCSPQEVEALARAHSDCEFITPGVRSPGKDAADQARVDTPVGALRKGATRLVIGRQIAQAKNPLQAFNDLVTEISQGL